MIKLVRGSSIPVLFWTVHVIVPTCMLFLFTTVSIYQVYLLQVNDFDYGNYLNLLWNIANGNGWDTSLYKDLFGFSFLGDHLVLVAAFFAPVLYIYNSPYALALMHGIAISSSFFIIPWLIRRIEGGEKNVHGYLWLALLFQGLLFISRPYLSAWRYESHMGTLVAPFVLVGIWALHSGRTKILWLAVAFLLIGQERSSIAVFGLGIYAFALVGRHRLGIFLCAISTFWFFTAVKIVIPWFQGGAHNYIYGGSVAPFKDITTKIYFLGQLAFCFMFLPFLGRRATCAALAALPLISLCIVSGRKSMYTIGHHYQDMISLFLLVAAIHGGFWLRRILVTQKIRPAIILLGIVIAFVLIGREGRRYSPLNVAVKLYTHPRKEQYIALRKDITLYINAPDSFQVFTQMGLGPQFALRTHRRVLTPERAAAPMKNALIVTSPIVDMWGTDYNKIMQEVMANNTLIPLLLNERVGIYISTDLQGNEYFRK